jgi:hypothetical protein
MKTGGGFQQSYNAQAAVEVESRLIVRGLQSRISEILGIRADSLSLHSDSPNTLSPKKQILSSQ